MTVARQTLRLKKTVFHRGRFIREVHLRAPTQADVDEASTLSERPLGRGIALLSILCDLDPMAIVKFDDEDLEQLQSLYDGVTT